MNYTSRFNLEFNPFIKNTKEILVETDAYKETKVRLDYLLQTKGIGVLTGDLGCGKTTIIRNWIETLNKAAYKVIYLPLSTLTVMESYRQLASSLNLMTHYRKQQNFVEIQQAIKKLAYEKKITPIIIFDEANYMSNAFLNDLKILFNFEMDSKDLAVAILVGQPVLNATLNLKHNEAVKQRIITSYNIENMSLEESEKYISEKLSSAGSTIQIFNPAAIRAISSYSSGNPRVISRVCDLSLMIADRLGKNTIDEDVALKAVSEKEL